MKIPAILASLAVIGATAASAMTIEDFESYADTDALSDAWYESSTYDGGDIAVSLNTDTTYADDTQSLCAVFQTDSTTYTVHSYTFLQYAVSTDDLTSILTDLSGDGSYTIAVNVYVTSTSWANIALILQTNHYSKGLTITGYLADGTTSNLTVDSWNTVYFTLTADEVSDLLGDDSTLTWGNLLLQLNGSSTTGTTYYVDNLVTGAAAVPEPASVALLGGLGVLGFVMIRRRRAA